MSENMMTPSGLKARQGCKGRVRRSKRARRPRPHLQAELDGDLRRLRALTEGELVGVASVRWCRVRQRRSRGVLYLGERTLGTQPCSGPLGA